MDVPILILLRLVRTLAACVAFLTAHNNESLSGGAPSSKYCSHSSEGCALDKSWAFAAVSAPKLQLESACGRKDRRSSTQRLSSSRPFTHKAGYATTDGEGLPGCSEVPRQEPVGVVVRQRRAEASIEHHHLGCGWLMAGHRRPPANRIGRPPRGVCVR